MRGSSDRQHHRNRLRRGTFLVWLLLTAVPAAGADIAVLTSTNKGPYAAAYQGLKATLGTDVPLHDMNKDAAAGKEAMKKIKGSAKLVVAIGPQALDVAKTDGGGLPVVFMMVSNPVKRLGGSKPNFVTGVSLELKTADLIKELKEALPDRTTLGLIHTNRTRDFADEIKAACESQGLALQARPVPSAKEVPTALNELVKGDIDCFWLIPDATILKDKQALQYIIQETHKQKIPILGPTSKFVKLGALLALSYDYKDIGKQTAEIARKVLQSGSAALPIIQARTIHPYFSPKIQGAFGITFSPDFKKRATAVE